MTDLSRRNRWTGRPHSATRSLVASTTIALAALLLLVGALATPTYPISARAASPLQASAVTTINEPVAAPLLEKPSPRVAQIGESTTIDISILSTPYATIDSNSPASGPQVWTVQAVVTNTGLTTAIVPIIDLDMNPNGSWFLQPGESRQRTLLSIPPGDAQMVYWFARRSNTINDPHTYTVTVWASNVNTVTQSVNAYENPSGQTVNTRSAIDTGNNGLVSASSDVQVGVAFTTSIDYDMGNNPQGVTLQPTGEPSFDPTAYRLLSSEVEFRDNSDVPIAPLYQDQLYFPPGSLPTGARKVKTTYTFIALRPGNVTLCPYTDVRFNATNKYDNGFCTSSGTLHITGTLTFSFTKSVDSTTVSQGELLTYTLRYTNTGDRPISNVYVWDVLPTETVTSSVSPASDPSSGFNTTDRVVWNIGTVAPSGSPGSTGQTTLSVLVNGRGSDIPDGTALVNQGFMGILFNPNEVIAAITSTITSTVQAPVIAISKSDEESNVIQGQTLTYTLRITNSGSLAATDLLITDVLPSDVTYSGGAVPAPASQSGQTLTWGLASLSGGGGLSTILVPVSVNFKLPNDSPLTNSMQVLYSNQPGYSFDVQSASDVDVVQSPVLSIAKRGSSSQVISGRNITYTLLITNSGSAAATNVAITDALPINTTFVSCSGGSSCGIDGGDMISWTVATIAPSATTAVTFTALTDEGLESGTTIVNQDYGVVSDQTNFVAGASETTSVFNIVAIVNGLAFNDLNGNGLVDGGESGISGLTVSLPGALQPVTTTNGSGQYTFILETPGLISVSAELAPASARTTSSPVLLDVSLETTTTVNFGYCFISTCPVGIVFGTVFEDANANGLQELGENGLSGVSIASTSAQTTPVTTNAFGQYNLTFASSGTYTVIETNAANYVSTTPDSVEQVVTIAASSQVDFGDFLGVRMQGQVFDDQNVNGVNDSESGISGAVVAAGTDSMLTGASGTYTLFVSVQPGQPITLTETDPASYVSTAAIPGSVALVRIDTNTLRLNNPVSGTVYADNDFGDVLPSTGIVTITGQIFDDANADGLYNDGGIGLGGGRVSASTGTFADTTVSGNFTLYGPPNTIIIVTETNPVGYVSTNAIPGNAATKFDLDTLHIGPLAADAASANNYFGDVLVANAAIITGTLFDDVNNNGMLDGGEGGFSGQQVSISGTVSLITTTNSGGVYAFAVGAGSFIINSDVPLGYYRTTPESFTIDTSLGSVHPDHDFGFSNDQNAATIFGTVFDDSNGNGLQDLGELGLSGAMISLTKGTTTLTTGPTGINGIYAFRLTQAGTWIVEETNPPGYFSTSPDRLNVPVALGNSYQRNFGDSNRTDTGSLHGVVFDDLNVNGIQDPSEPGIPGVMITTTADNGIDVVSATTLSSGEYSYPFSQVSGGFRTVYEINAAGYRSTTPDVVVANVLPGFAVVVNFGDCQVSLCSSVIQGTVFNDANGDGNQDFSELGISGVTVSLYSGATLIEQTATRSNGDYTFDADNGVYRVIETDPPGYHSTTPNEVHVPVNTPDTYVANFGDSNNSLLASIFGTVFEDADGNSVFDADELGIPDVTVEIDGNFSGNPTTNVTTDQNGQYTFLIDQITPSNVFTVTQTDLPDYVSTTPNEVVQIVALDNDYVVNFGDFNGAQVEGSIFADQNNNGAWDKLDEPTITATPVTLTSSGGLIVQSDVQGGYTLYAQIVGGFITVTETVPVGYSATTPTSLTFAATSGQTYTDKDFGLLPPICAADSYEAMNDDAFITTNVTLVAGASPQSHNLLVPNDQDWLKVTLQQGSLYTITTDAVGARADTVLKLFAPDGVTQLAYSDDYPGATNHSSQIVWEPTVGGTYYLRVTQLSSNISGCDTDYTISMIFEPKPTTTEYITFLPLVVRNHP